MENQAFNFTSAPENRCALPTVGLVITFEKSLKQLVVLCPDGTQTVYTFVVNGDSKAHALFMATSTSRQMQVGQVDFKGHDTIVFEIPLNVPDFYLAFSDSGLMEHIGSLDIRDIGKVIKGKTVFDFAVMPIELRVLGNNLVVTTLKFQDTHNPPSWYIHPPVAPQP